MRPFLMSLFLAVGVGLGAELAESWHTAPPLTELFPEADLWSTRTVPFAELAGGVKAVSGPDGKLVGRWVDHPRYPTIHTTAAPTDWSQAEALVWRVYSAKATNERLLVGVRCDNPATHAADFRVAAIRVDWTGWRELSLPLAQFSALGDPAGWNQVSGFFLFTKVFHWQPHPATELLLGELRVGKGGTPTDILPLPTAPQVGGVEVAASGPLFDGYWLNHTSPEVRQTEPLELPLTYEPYFLTERATRGYLPRFVPGPVSVAPDGRLWILAAGYMLETCDANGQWQTTDLMQEVIAPYARQELGFSRLTIWNKGQLNEGCIRFDRDGDMYVLVALYNTDGDWRTRTGLLLHRRHGGTDWTVYRLPFYMARFEKLVGHNPDALLHPPVILLTRYQAPGESFVLVPEKRADGTLILPEPITIGTDTIGFLPHSGEANQALSVDDGIYVAYGRMAVLPGRTKEEGVPAYLVRYDRTTRNLSDPIFLGSGGKNALDNHNWPTLAADSKGLFHVLINGHHDPFVYTHSLSPEPDRWSEPEKVSAGTTYAGLVVGPDDTLYSVTRCSDPGYYFRLTLHRKRPGQPWEQQHLVVPCKPYYHVWYHKLSIDPRTGRLFLAYFAQTGHMCLFRDELEAYLYQRPDLAATMLGSGEQAKLPLGTYRSKERKYEFYGVPGGEPGILTSADGGTTWHLATTPDFLP